MKMGCKNHHNTAVAIFSFNRPRYLKEVIKSIEKNTFLDDLDFYFFQDGAVNKFSGRVAASEEKIKKCLSIWDRAALPNKHLIRNNLNLGIGISQFEAKELLFCQMGYDRVMFFEDDLVLNRNYIRTLRIMLDQFQNENGVGAVMCHGGEPRIYTESETRLLLCRVRTANDQLWGWAMWNDRWQKIKPAFLEYYKFIKDVDYKRKPRMEITAFYIERGFNIKVTSQDAAIYYALTTNNLVTLGSFTHRGKYIGAKGLHMSPDQFKKLGYEKVSLVKLEEDAKLEKFIGYDEKEFLACQKSIFMLNPPTQLL